MYKYLLFLLLLNVTLNAKSEIKLLTWDLTNKSLLGMPEKEVKNILNTDVDIIALQNVKNDKEIRFFNINKYIATKKKDFNDYHKISSYFLLNKKIKDYFLSNYRDVFRKDFKIPPIAIIFNKNNKNYMIININLTKTMNENYINTAKIQDIMEYYSYKNDIPIENIVVTGNFNLPSVYIKNLPLKEIKLTGTAKTVLKNNKLVGDNINTIVNKLTKAVSYNYLKIKPFNLYTYQHQINNNIPLITELNFSKELPSIQKKKEMIKKYNLMILK